MSHGSKNKSIGNSLGFMAERRPRLLSHFLHQKARDGQGDTP